MRPGSENTGVLNAALTDYGGWLYVLIGGCGLLVLALALAVRKWRQTGDRSDLWGVVTALPLLVVMLALLMLLNSGPRYVSVPLALVIASFGASYLIASVASRLVNHCWDTRPIGLLKHFGVLIGWAITAIWIVVPIIKILGETSPLLIALAVTVGWMTAPYLVRSMVDRHHDPDEDQHEERSLSSSW